MKLQDIETFVVGNPPPHNGGRYFVFVKLTTDGNVHGVGEAYCVPFHPDLVARMLEDVFDRYLCGEDPHDIEKMWHPVYKLLGGRVHERLRSYTYLYARPGDRADVYQDADFAAERAVEYIAEGFTALKFDPFGPYSAFDGRQPSLAALDLCERFV